MMTKDSQKTQPLQLTLEDKELFRKAVAKLGNRQATTVIEDMELSDQPQHGHLNINLDNDRPKQIINQQQILSFSRSGIQTGLLKKLKRGHYKPQMIADLHGLNVNQAREKIKQWLAIALDRGYRFILIIHGKGLSSNNQQPILKSYVNYWLKQLTVVLAFCSAPKHQGGKGATYVLLKTNTHFHNES